MEAIQEHSSRVGTAPMCKAYGVSRATVYRRRHFCQKGNDRKETIRRTGRALGEAEKQVIVEVLNSDRFMDKSPGEVYATLLDEEKYYCSERTMYRILNERGEVRERRNQLRNPQYKKPELLATGPNQVWSWDITKLKGPAKWTYYYLYVMLDIFSRYVVGWVLARRESGALAKRLIQESCEKQEIDSDGLTIHSDRGSSMTSKSVAQLMADFGITKSHSRPYVSNDNPFSESQFKTMKYRPEFPERFGSPEDGLCFCRTFFSWYNTEHRHSGIGMLTPEQVHYGLSNDVMEKRKEVLRAAYEQHPERFVHGIPTPPRLLESVWINPPKNESKKENQGVPVVWTNSFEAHQRSPVSSISDEDDKKCGQTDLTSTESSHIQNVIIREELH